jgi:iron only hydrogenase large subunit-like protein
LKNIQHSKEFNSTKVIIISISPQSRASIANYYKISNIKAHKKLITLFKKLGVDYIFDTSFSREFSLMESASEFIHRYKQTKQLKENSLNNKNSSNILPMLASACPGWICYAEKTHGDFIIPYISTTKSPQQIMGTIVKYYFSKQINKNPNDIYHTTIMPCYDKKLEASRDDFYNDIFNTKDVDCVLTTTEIIDIIKEKQIDFINLEESPIDKLFTNIDNEEKFFGISGSSGGYLEYIFKKAAKELFGIHIDNIEYKNLRDIRIATLEINGKIVLSFAEAYGFKNIQNIVRKLKKSICTYDFVEIMACPGGCLNGGGQIKSQKGENPKKLLKNVEEIYNDQKILYPDDNKIIQELYVLWFDGIFSPIAKKNLHTQYHKREKIVNPLTIKW